MWAKRISCTHLQAPNWPGPSQQTREHFHIASQWQRYVNSYCQEKRHNKQPVPSTQRGLQDKHLVHSLNDNSGKTGLIQDMQHSPELHQPPPTQFRATPFTSSPWDPTPISPEQSGDLQIGNSYNSRDGLILFTQWRETNKILNFLHLYVFRGLFT